VLSLITKNGEIESASRLLIVLVIMTMQFGRINASMRSVQALKLNKCEFSKEGPHFLTYGVEAQLAI
jgi:hypothetical protein